MVASTQEQHSEEGVASLAIFIQAVVLAAVLALGHCLARRGVDWIGDAGLALCAGAGLSAVLYLAGIQEVFQPLVSFNKGGCCRWVSAARQLPSPSSSPGLAGAQRKTHKFATGNPSPAPTSHLPPGARNWLQSSFSSCCCHPSSFTPGIA